MGKREDAIKGQFGKSKGYKTTEQNPLEEETKIKELLLNDESVDPTPLDIGQSMPEQGTQDNSRFPAANDAYSMMAQRLEESMGPQEQYSDSFLGGLQSVASGLTPESVIAEGNTVERQQKAAMDLANLQGKQKAVSRLKIPAKQFVEMSDSLSNISRNRRATKRIRAFMQGRKDSELKDKIGLLEGLWTNAEQWIRREMKSQDIDAARATKDYWTYVNSEIKAITGAQISEPEARRLMRQMPNWNDKPETFMAVWDDIMEERERSIFNRVRSFKRGNWHGVEGFQEQAYELEADPYKRTVWANPDGQNKLGRKQKKMTRREEWAALKKKAGRK